MHTSKYTENELFIKRKQEIDMVNHPKHYKRKGFEVIDIIEAFTEGLEGIEATDTGNAIKYILRWSEKNGIEDLKKCVWYVNHLINKLEDKNEIQKVEEKLQKEECKELMRVRESLYFHEKQLSHFKCPKCGGNISRNIKHSNNLSQAVVIGQPECESCGDLYIIQINEDLSYEILDKIIAKNTKSNMERL